ncbi:MAG TPA: trehalose-phosphatase [Burkholderiales bacterium]|nr:trehalose-phosphatase [Burkholderiales bacterium]
MIVAFDFDGTLAPIVSRPSDARMRPSTRLLLKGVARLYPTVVLTGRARADVACRLRGIALAAIVGNHGFEGGGIRTKAFQIARRWRGALRALARIPGVAIEDKGHTLAIHYRNAANRAAARRNIVRVVVDLSPQPRIVPGKALINLLPDLNVNKGTALLRLLRSYRAHGAIFVGDDRTDEDVFNLPPSRNVLTICVGRSASSTARYRIVDARHIDRLLAQLIAIRETAKNSQYSP